MSILSDIPLSPEANQLTTRIQPLIKEGLEKENKVAVSVLLWGSEMSSVVSLPQLERICGLNCVETICGIL